MKKLLLIIICVLAAFGLSAQNTRERMDAVSRQFGVNFIYESGLDLDFPCNAE